MDLARNKTQIIEYMQFSPLIVTHKDLRYKKQTAKKGITCIIYFIDGQPRV